MDAEQGPTRALASAAFHAVAEGASRTSPGKLRCPVALVRHRSGIVLARDLGLFRRSELGAFQQGAWAAQHAGSGVVPGRAAQLCGLYSRARASRGDGHHERARGRAAAADELGHAGRPGAHPGDATAPHGRSARRSRRGGAAQCSAGGDRNPGNHQHWRHLELLRPGLRHQGRVGALQATGAQGLFLRRCLPVRRQALRPHRRTARHPEGAGYRRSTRFACLTTRKPSRRCLPACGAGTS